MKFDFRDVSSGLVKLREFLLGRKSVNPHRFPPMLASRTIPPPDVPRGPEYKYSDQYYGARDVLNSVKPPVVAPVAEGKSGRVGCYPSRPVCSQPLKFPSELPTPGCVWWFDAHCYYKEVSQVPCGPSNVPSPPAPRPPCPPPEPPRGGRGTKQSSEIEICEPCLPVPEEKKCVY